MATSNPKHTPLAYKGYRLPINVDLVAIAIGITLAVLVRFGVIHQIGF